MTTRRQRHRHERAIRAKLHPLRPACQLAARHSFLPLPPLQRPIHSHARPARMVKLRYQARAPARHKALPRPAIDVLPTTPLHIRRPAAPRRCPPPLAHLAIHLPRSHHPVRRRQAIGPQTLYDEAGRRFVSGVGVVQRRACRELHLGLRARGRHSARCFLRSISHRPPHRGHQQRSHQRGVSWRGEGKEGGRHSRSAGEVGRYEAGEPGCGRALLF